MRAASNDRFIGVPWGWRPSGDLRYSIVVNGHTFKQTGGDDGILTGAFFGESHEGMGGVLEREDLTAAFGGKRQVLIGPLAIAYAGGQPRQGTRYGSLASFGEKKSGSYR